MEDKISRYREIRSIGMALNTKLFKAIDGIELRIAARSLGLLKNGKLIIKNEADMDRFTDFLINDHIDQNGKTVVTKYLEQKANGLTKDEKIILDSLLLAKPSLYEVIEIDRSNSSITLTDILNEEPDYIVTDLGLSQSSILGKLLFTRLVCLEDIRFTSGAAMLFEGIHKNELLEKRKLYAQKSPAKSESARQVAAFMKLHKKIGFQQMIFNSPEL